jgi:hypothetical protein
MTGSGVWGKGVCKDNLAIEFYLIADYQFIQFPISCPEMNTVVRF